MIKEIKLETPVKDAGTNENNANHHRYCGGWRNYWRNYCGHWRNFCGRR